MDWTTERVELAKKLWAEGRSATEIANRLGGFTRSAVLGKLNRLGLLKTREKPSAPARVPRAPRPIRLPKDTRLVIAGCGAVLQVPKAHPPRQVVEPPKALVASKPKPWIEREPGECAYPVSEDGADVHSCCAPVKGDGAYCKAHRRLMFQPKKPKATAERLYGEIKRRFAA